MKTFLKVLLWIAIILVVIFLTLFIAYKVSGEFNSMWEMIQYILGQVGIKV